MLTVVLFWFALPVLSMYPCKNLIPVCVLRKVKEPSQFVICYCLTVVLAAFSLSCDSFRVTADFSLASLLPVSLVHVR